MMRNAGAWWPRVSVAGVLVVLAVALVVGLRPAPDAAVALRAAAPSSSPAEAAIESPVPGALLAPIEARRANASSGQVAYALVGGALTLADIPTHALAAYQRAATVINLADDRCHLDWELVAALGKVLTDHGRLHGSELDDEGVSRPFVRGQRLTGRHGTARVPDTDAGLYDRDPELDRAVGPMLLLPAVWSVVNVDADADGRRNPQDVDDAALSAAVFLCAGPGDFRNASHLRSEVRRYHSGSDYTKSVLGVRTAYREAQPVATTVSVLAREEGVSPEIVVVPAPDDPSFAGGTTFAPGTSTAPTPASPSPSGPAAPSPTAHPGPTQGPSATPSESPSDGPTPSDAPSPSTSPTACPSPTGGPGRTEPTEPTGEPSATGSPERCPLPTPTPTGSPNPEGGVGASDPEPAAGVAAALALPVPMGAVLVWWRRRRRPTDVA